MNPNYYQRVMGVESSGNPSAKNPRSSASGHYQFTDGTFLPIARGLFPGQDDRSLMAMKNDPNVQRQAMEVLTKQNSAALSSAGHEVNDPNLYLAHFAGAGGATKLLGSDPSTPVVNVLGRQVVDANPFLANMTVGDMKNWASAKMNGQNFVAPPNGQQPQQPQQQPVTPYTDSMLEGGPMALFGMGQQGYDWGNALIGLGSSLASINSPQQAQAIAGLRRPSSGNAIDVEVDKNTGLVYRTNKRTGQVDVRHDPAIQNQILEAYRGRKKIEEESQGFKPTTTTEKMWNENNDNLVRSTRNLDDLKLYQEAVKNGQIDLSLLGRLHQGAAGVSDQQNPKFNMTNAFYGFLESMRNDSLRLNKGTQTEGDAERALNEFMPKGGMLNNQMSETALARIGRAYTSNVERMLQENGSILKRSPKASGYFDPDGTFQTKYGTASEALTGYKDHFENEFKRLTTPKPQPDQPASQGGVSWRIKQQQK